MRLIQPGRLILLAIVEKRFGLSKAERICRKSIIEKVFLEGKSFFSYPFRCIWLEEQPDNTAAAASVLFSVSKRNHKRAVTRNLLKRRMREAYRLNKELLKHDPCVQESGVHVPDQPSRKLYICFVYTSKQVEPYRIIEHGLQKALRTLTKNRFQDSRFSADPVDPVL